MNLSAKTAFEQKIFLLRSQKVMLSHDLARLYGVETKVLLQAVKRNAERFPKDFAFILEDQDVNDLRSQIVTLETHWRYKPYAFTEQGIAMLSSVLRSEKAIKINIAIMRAFVKMRHEIDKHRELTAATRKLEKKITGHNEDIETIFAVLRQLTAPETKKKNRVGFI